MSFRNLPTVGEPDKGIAYFSALYNIHVEGVNAEIRDRDY